MTNPDTTSVFDPDDTGWLDGFLEHHGREKEQLIPALQAIQRRFRYLPQKQLEHLGTCTGSTPAAITGVATFYDQFRFRPAGRHMVKVCTGTACHVKGALPVYDALLRALGCTGDEDTGADGMFTLQKVACLGCCTLAPVVQIDTVTYGRVTATSAPDILHDFINRDKTGSVPPAVKSTAAKKDIRGEVRIGAGSCCMAGGSAAVIEETRAVLQELGNPAHVKKVGCVGMCHRTPLLEIVLQDGTTYTYEHVQESDVPMIIRNHFKAENLFGRLASIVETAAETVVTGVSRHVVLDSRTMRTEEKSVRRFLDKQVHIATEHHGKLDPASINDYLRYEGFTALEKVLSGNDPERVIDVIHKSGLRGRGGAGFPTADKWRLVRDNNSPTVYIVCNGDEGDPGAFMDRMLFESFPFRIIEGMLIAAFAAGATEGVLYIRAEYPLAVMRVNEALKECRTHGYLGRNIRGSGFSLELRIMQGAGAFVCGEETALLQSIEGKRGMPRFRPPYPARNGLFGAPTLINNCETYACVPWIIRNGADAFSRHGTTSGGTGTKVFSLAGKVRYGGLIEVPMGITLHEIVEEIGGGITGERKFKAVQIGGPSGGCIPSTVADIPVDYAALADAGAMMGSGGLVVLDETDCMVDIARYFLTFTQQQSCGRCTMCRIGTRRMLDILEKICAGNGNESDLQHLEELARSVAAGSLCGLGKTAPNPVLTTLRYFREEYIAHCNGVCPAGKCKELISYVITDSCIGCTRCAQRCPADAIPFTPYRRHNIDMTKCTRCDVCRTGCPAGAINIESDTKQAVIGTVSSPESS